MKSLNRQARGSLLVALLIAGCSSSDSPTAPTTPDPTPVDEAAVLISYVEANRSYNVHGGFVIKSSDVRTNVVTGANQYVIDMRAPEDFAAGHIEGAVNVAWGDLVNHLETLPGVDSYDVIVLACYSGQTAAYATGILRALGHENVKSMKWGMSSWHEDFGGPWINGRSNSRATQFVTGASPAKNAAGDYPDITTGFTTGEDILKARVNTVMNAGFGPAKMTNANLFNDLNGHYIINYWPASLYESVGHVPGAVMYEPSTTPFLSSTFLKTLPTDKPLVIYCYTGQTSAYLSGFLRVLGYDAHTLLYGANGMIFDKMIDEGVANAFVPENEIHDYEYVN